MASQVDRTKPGSRNDWRITYSTGSQKWTDDRPGDGVGESDAEMMSETLKDPSVQRGLSAIQKAIKGGSSPKGAVEAMVRDIGTEKGRVVLNAVHRAAKEAKSSEAEGWDKARKMVAGIKDVVKRIFRVFDLDKAKEMAERVVDFWRTKNQRSDLKPDEQRAIYRPVDYGDVLPLTKKRKLDIGWTDHAEYRSDLRDVDPDAVNEAIRDRLRDKLNPPQRKKMKFKEPGLGTMVVDFNTQKSPAQADVITVWGAEKFDNGLSGKRRASMTPDEIVEKLYHSKDPGVSAVRSLMYSIWSIGKVDWKAAKKELAKYPSGRRVVRGMEALPAFKEISRNDGGYWKHMKAISREEKVSIDREWEGFEKKVLRKIEGEMVRHYQERGVVSREELASRMVRVARTLMAVRTFTVYGDEYPLDSKFAKTMAKFLPPPDPKYRQDVLAWDAIRDWAKKKRADEDDVESLLNAIDMGAAGYAVGHPVRSVRDVQKVADRLGL